MSEAKEVVERLRKRAVLFNQETVLSTGSHKLTAAAVRDELYGAADLIGRLEAERDGWVAWAEGLTPAEISNGHANHVAAAVAVEREACAVLAGSFNGHTFPSEIAAAIRARSTHA